MIYRCASITRGRYYVLLSLCFCTIFFSSPLTSSRLRVSAVNRLRELRKQGEQLKGGAFLAPSASDCLLMATLFPSASIRHLHPFVVVL